MNTNCSLICQKDFVLDLLKNQPCEIDLKYEQTVSLFFEKNFFEKFKIF